MSIDTAEFDLLSEYAGLAYLTFRPRADQPQRFDEQTAFYDSRLPGVAFVIGGNGSGTTEICLAKTAKFILRDQPPPRRDTPFWIISGSYEQCMETAWAEKLHGHGHIPACEIDADRIVWYSSKRNWPASVPLKPWPGRPGKNWLIEFKSYEQGRQAFQARAIGGFCFIEQFPWEILEEVLARAREYNFPGGKMAEFTPIDPLLSIPLQTMLEENRLPPGWQVFRCNTECAVEAGHVSREWFDEFFGMLPVEMRAVRMIGAFASFEGLIYQSFDSRVHLVDEVEIPRNVHHRRGIDWGFSREHPFVCLWGYKDGFGRWWIYDEYYSTDQSLQVSDHLYEVATRHPWPDHPNWGTTWGDPSSPEHLRLANRLGEYVEDCPNISMLPASNAVYEGIDYVRFLLKPVPTLGTPRLMIDRKRCPNLAREMQTYRWEQGTARGLNPRAGRPKPLKKWDDAVDALRYMVFSEAGGEYNPESIPRTEQAGRHGVHFKKSRTPARRR